MVFKRCIKYGFKKFGRFLDLVIMLVIFWIMGIIFVDLYYKWINLIVWEFYFFILMFYR